MCARAAIRSTATGTARRRLSSICIPISIKSTPVRASCERTTCLRACTGSNSRWTPQSCQSRWRLALTVTSHASASLGGTPSRRTPSSARTRLRSMPRLEVPPMAASSPTGCALATLSWHFPRFPLKEGAAPRPRPGSAVHRWRLEACNDACNRAWKRERIELSGVCVRGRERGDSRRPVATESPEESPRGR